jgi:hypothetical protein
LRGTRSRPAFAISPLAIALLLLGMLTAFRVGGTVDSDVAWQLWIAQRMQAGADLYRDVIETNPPLWFWMAQPIEWMSRLLQLRIEAALVLAIAVAAAVSLAATDRLLAQFNRLQRTLFLSFAAIALFAVPWMQVGQREQIALIGTLPYAALLARRRDGNPASAVLAASIGVGAAAGFALKHYFLLAPLFLELWLVIARRRAWRPVRPETITIAAVGLGYAAAMWIERDYVTSIIPLLTQAYGTYSAPGLSQMLGLPALIGLAMLGALLASYRTLLGSESSLGTALVVAALAFAAAYFIQFKGWPYHAIPMVGCASLALVAVLIGDRRSSRSMILIGPALLCLPLYLTGRAALTDPGPDRDLQRAIAGLPAGTPVGFIAENTALAWSVTLQHQFAYPQRYNGYWMLGALVRSEQNRNASSALESFWRQAVSHTVADFECLPPRRIIVARPLAGSWNAGIVDPLPYFLRDPAFAELLGHYRVVSRSTVEVYEQVSPLPKSTSACVRGR